MLNWGLVPQIKTVHRSPILFYTQVRDVGSGVIELTWVVHNFSTRNDIVFDHLNHVDYGLLSFDAEQTPLKSVAMPSKEEGSIANFRVLTHPVAGTSLDWKFPADHPHHDYYNDLIGYSMDENNSEWDSLVGYAYENKPPAGD